MFIWNTFRNLILLCMLKNRRRKNRPLISTESNGLKENSFSSTHRM